MNNNTQLTPANDSFNTDRIQFSEPITGSIPDSKPAISFKRIIIQTENQDGTIGDLILPTQRIFTFGISENANMDTGMVNGYTLPLVLWNRDGHSKEEKSFSDTFDRIVEKCKDHLIENREEIEHYDLERNDLKKLNPLYWKKERGKIVEGSGPTLYSKLICSKKNGDIKILTMFYDLNDNPIPPSELFSKRGYVKGAIKIESIFIGNKISLQVKLYECIFEPIQNGMKRLLTRPKAEPKVIISNQKSIGSDLSHINSEEESNDEEINYEEESNDEESKKSNDIQEDKKVRKVRKVRKVVKKRG